ncbi:hypothetical protein V1281_007364 [Nitrobacteraceae bacterium AZCC 2161]
MDVAKSSDDPNLPERSYMSSEPCRAQNIGHLLARQLYHAVNASACLALPGPANIPRPGIASSSARV